MSRAMTPPMLALVVILAVSHHGFAAPVVQDVSVDKRRESTKETIELEETLKQLAGEDKKFFSNSMVMPMPQVDGLQADVGGSGEEEVEEVEEAPHPPTKLHPLEDQLMELPELQQPVSRFPIPGPYGPGLQSADGGRETEYEPSMMRLPGKEEEGEEEEEEDYYLERVMATLRRHPELLDEIMQGDEREEDGLENAVSNSEAPQVAAGDIEDYEDRVEQIQAELDQIRASQSQPPPAAEAAAANVEDRQDFIGDRESHVVSKKHLIIPHEYVKDNIESLNKYFEKYSDEDGHEDVPIM